MIAAAMSSSMTRNPTSGPELSERNAAIAARTRNAHGQAIRFNSKTPSSFNNPTQNDHRA